MGLLGRDEKRRSRGTKSSPVLTELEHRVLLAPTPLRISFPVRAAAVSMYRRPNAPRPIPPADLPRALPAHATLDDQVGFAYHTVQDSQRIASSPQVRDVGLDYAKLSVSSDARKVGAAYLKAAIRGDGNDLQRLGKTPLVNKVGNQFHKLSESSSVQKLGNAFERFGKSVAREFNRLFGLD